MDRVLKKIHSAGLKFLVPLTPEETYKTIVQEAIKLVDANQGSIFLVDEDNLLQRVYATSDVLYSYLPRKSGNLVKAFKRNYPTILDANVVIKVHPELEKIHAKSIIHIPLSNQAKTNGIMVIYSSHDNFFDNQQLDILKLFSLAASLAIKKAQLYEEISHALEIRDRFISIAAHELRTPLTTINGYIHLLKNRLSNKDTDEARWIDELSLESSRMTQLVNELLAVNRIKNGQLHFEWKRCNLTEINNRVITNFSFSYPNRQLIYDSQADKNAYVIGDYDKLIQVIDNILDNAVKFSPEKTPIKFNLLTKNKYFTIQITDQGKGIKKSDFTRILDWYSRSDTDVDGMGVGLSLAKYIIDAHHGTLNIRSKPNRGTTMRIKIPQARI